MTCKCGAKFEPNPKANGQQKWCSIKCRDRNLAREMRKKRAVRGDCIFCGKVKEDPSSCKCSTCRAKIITNYHAKRPTAHYMLGSKFAPTRPHKLYKIYLADNEGFKPSKEVEKWIKAHIDVWDEKTDYALYKPWVPLTFLDEQGHLEDHFMLYYAGYNSPSLENFIIEKVDRERERKWLRNLPTLSLG